MLTTEGRKRTRLLRHEHGQFSEGWDTLAEEAPLEIVVAHLHPQTRLLVEEPLAVTMRTPGSDRELALGLLLAEGVIDHSTAVKDVAMEKNSRDQSHRLTVTLHHPPRRALEDRRRGLYASSSCGLCGKADLAQVELPEKPVIRALEPTIAASLLSLLPATLRLHQTNFEATGGLHAAALVDREGNLLSLFEDIGRHNALDKVIGQAATSGPWPLHEQILILSGRVSFELIQKAAVAHIPIIAALGAPSSLAVELAQHFGQTLVGFLSKDRFNLYTHPQRIGSL